MENSGGAVFSLGLSVLAVVGALFVTQISREERVEPAYKDACARYGRFECCVREEEKERSAQDPMFVPAQDTGDGEGSSAGGCAASVMAE